MLLKRIYYILLYSLLLTGSWSCTQDPKKETNWEVQYTMDSKDPYGFYLFGEILPGLFPGAKVHYIPSNAHIFTASSQRQKSVYVILAGSMAFSEEEMLQLDNWMYEGNDVVMITNDWDSTLVNALSLEVVDPGDYFSRDKALLQKTDTVLTRKADGQKGIYTYQRRYFNIFNQYWKPDSSLSHVTEIAWNAEGKPNAVALQIGEGRLIMVTNFLACSNYFLLQQHNREYLSDIMGFVSTDIKNLYIAVDQNKRSSRSDWDILWQHKATRAAIILSALGLLVYVLFGLKRRQKIIPEVAPLTNDAASFVETIAGLYYKTHDNKNLAQKMIQHFFEHVRSGYQLNTNTLDEAFVEKLSMRSGIGQAETSYLVTQIRQVLSDSIAVNDHFLHSLYKNIQSFYKK